jgi:hypothetical protein
MPPKALVHSPRNDRRSGLGSRLISTRPQVARASGEPVRVQLAKVVILRITPARPDEFNAVNALMYDELIDIDSRLADI